MLDIDKIEMFISDQISTSLSSKLDVISILHEVCNNNDQGNF